jgi:hypothetical protein
VQLQSVPDTALAQSLTRSGTQRDVGLLSYLQEGAVFNLSGTLMNKIMTQGIDAMMKACPAQAGEDMEKMKALVTAIGQQFKGSDALSVKLTPTQAPYVSMQYVAQVVDGDKLREQVAQLAGLMEAQLPADAPKFNFKSGGTTQGGVRVDTAQWSVPDNKGPVKNVDTRMAYLDKLFVLSAGSDTESGLGGLLTKVKKTGPAPQEVTKVLADAGTSQQAELVAVLNVSRLIQQMPQKDPSAGGAPPTMPSQSAMVAQLNLDQGRADFGLTLPKTHLQEITQALQMMMMQKMMQKKQPAPPTAPGN